MAYQSHNYPYQIGTPPSNPMGSPSRFQTPQAGVRPPRPAVGPGQGQQAGQGSQGSQNSKFPLLQFMSTEQLQALLDNEDQMKEMVEDVDDVSCHGCTGHQIGQESQNVLALILISDMRTYFSH